jgi:Flp pilus assembly protein TadG
MRKIWQLSQSIVRAALRDQRGGVALPFAIALGGLAFGSSVVMDYSNASTQRTRLQGVADASALAAVREFRLGNASSSIIMQAAQNHASTALSGGKETVVVAPSVDVTNKTVTVRLSTAVSSFFPGITGRTSTEIAATATAKMVGGAPICVIGLDEKVNSTVEMEKTAKLNAPECAVYSNSKSSTGLVARNYASMKAAFICSAGGKSSPGPGSFVPEPKTDCPVIPDPLAQRKQPVASGCTATAMIVKGSMLSLSPGTYCGGLTLTDAARVTFSPGVFIFKDGPLVVTGGATLQGINVGLHFTGKGAAMKFDTLSSVSLTAPKSGDMAGLLISEDRTVTVGQQFDILSNDARMLLGTIYIPQGRLFVAANAPVADKSAYTVVVARRFSLSEGPTMVLNTNYGATDIPVPVGVGPSGQSMLTN